MWRCFVTFNYTSGNTEWKPRVAEYYRTERRLEERFSEKNSKFWKSKFGQKKDERVILTTGGGVKGWLKFWNDKNPFHVSGNSARIKLWSAPGHVFGSPKYFQNFFGVLSNFSRSKYKISVKFFKDCLEKFTKLPPKYCFKSFCKVFPVFFQKFSKISS